MNRRTLAPTCCLLSGLFAALTAPVTGQTVDYTVLPKSPEKEQARLAEARISFSEALEKAAIAGGGEVVSARVILNDDTLRYEVLVDSGGIAKRILIDGETGDALAPKFTLVLGVKKALEQFPGQVSEASLDLLADTPSIHVTVFSDGKRNDIQINALTGSILNNNISDGKLPGIETDNEMQKMDSGLQFIDMVEGDGEEPDGPTSLVKVHYTGYLVDGTKFGSSFDSGTPLNTPLNRVIKGWTEGVGSMKVGGKRKLIIPADLGYGEGGRPPRIPPNAVLIFDIELLQTD